MFDILLNDVKIPPKEPSEALKEAMQLGLMSGSSVWGVHKESSDIDIFLNSSHSDIISRIKEDYTMSHCLDCQYDKEDFNAYRLEGTKYNVIVCHDVCIYESRKYATNIFSELCNISEEFRDIIRNKEQRVKMFIALCDNYEKENC